MCVQTVFKSEMNVHEDTECVKEVGLMGQGTKIEKILLKTCKQEKMKKENWGENLSSMLD